MRKQLTERGSMYIMAVVIITILFLLGMVFLWFMGSRRKMAVRLDNQLHAHYLAEAGIERGTRWITDLIRQPLILDNGEVNELKLRLIDRSLAGEFTKTIKERLFDDGEYTVHITIVNVNETPFKCNLEPVPGEQLPEPLLPYRKQDGDGLSTSRSLGGWEGELSIRALGVAGLGSSAVKVGRELQKSIKVTDLSPPAPDYTLFIHGDGKETLKAGRFVLSNWEFDGTAGETLVQSIESLAEVAFKAIPVNARLSLEELIELVKNYVSMTRDNVQKQLANEVIMNLHPWGRIRTNGSLNVYLPFFEIDDVINYFVDNKYYQRPEVGYPGCYNRLHDRYMAKYTKYEGNVEKHYYELAPYVLRRQYPRQRNQKYTRFSTFRYYPQQNPSEKMPRNLENLAKAGKKYASQNFPRGMRMSGTEKDPLQLDGIMYINGVLDIHGVVKGRGVLIADGDINVHGDITHADDETYLALITPKGKINLKVPEVEMKAAVYANGSIMGGTKLKLKGNLVVNKLNRQKGEDAVQTTMPTDCEISFDRNNRNIMAANVYASISYADIVRRQVAPVLK